MADAYGVHVVGLTDDFQGDINGICGALNQFDGWSNDGALFNVLGGVIWIPESQDPTVFPTRTTRILVPGAGGEHTWRPAADATESDLDGAIALENEEVPLSEVAAAVSPYISAGTVTVACVSNEKGRYISYEKMVLHTQGAAERTREMVHSGSAHKVSTEKTG